MKAARRAFTRWDLAICLATVTVMAIWLPMLARPKIIVCRVRCASNLKQVALAFHLWTIDRDSTNFPWSTQTVDGTAPYAKSPEVFRHFTAISNELQNAQTLTCPDDKTRTPTTSWTSLSNTSISYFINLTQFTAQQDVLLGDRHLSTNANILRGYHVISDPALLRWTKDIHPHSGNVALVDTSVQRVTTKGAQSLLTNVPIRLAIP